MQSKANSILSRSSDSLAMPERSQIRNGRFRSIASSLGLLRELPYSGVWYISSALTFEANFCGIQMQASRDADMPPFQAARSTSGTLNSFHSGSLAHGNSCSSWKRSERRTMTSPFPNCSGSGSRSRVMPCLLVVSEIQSRLRLPFYLQMLEA